MCVRVGVDKCVDRDGSVTSLTLRKMADTILTEYPIKRSVIIKFSYFQASGNAKTDEDELFRMTHPSHFREIKF